MIRAAKSDSRLANNNLPPDIQKLRCRACYEALRFAPQIESMGKVIAEIILDDHLNVFLYFHKCMPCNSFIVLNSFVLVVGRANEVIWSLHCFAFTV